MPDRLQYGAVDPAPSRFSTADAETLRWVAGYLYRTVHESDVGVRIVREKAADLEALADRIVDAVVRPAAPTVNQPDTAAVAEGLAILDRAALEGEAVATQEEDMT